MDKKATPRLRAVDVIVLAIVASCVALLALELGTNIRAELARLGWGG